MSWTDPRSPTEIARYRRSLQIASAQSAVRMLEQVKPSRERDAALDRARKSLAKLLPDARQKGLDL